MTASILDILHRTNQHLNQRFAAAVGDDGPTPRQLAVMGVLAKSEGLSQAEISNETGIDRATTAGIVARLGKAGYVKRKRTWRDARAYAVNLTDKGRNELARCLKTSEVIEEQFLAILTQAERDKLVQYLNRLCDARLGEARLGETRLGSG